MNVKFAMVENDRVINTIVADESQQAELEEALGVELVYEPLINLSIGDMRVDNTWTRNVDGIQTVLTEKPTYDELETQLKAAEIAMQEGVDSIVDDE